MLHLQLKLHIFIGQLLHPLLKFELFCLLLHLSTLVVNKLGKYILNYLRLLMNKLYVLLGHLVAL